eukprot:4168538-Pyramimonas_sp.AAC.1
MCAVRCDAYSLLTAWGLQVWDRRILGSTSGAPVGVLLGHTEGITHIDSKVRTGRGLAGLHKCHTT